MVHEVIERPESVSLVRPPMSTMEKVRAEIVKKKYEGNENPEEGFVALVE